MFRAPLPVLPRVLGRVFPAGLFEMVEGRRRFEEELPSAWPERDLWLCTVDIVSGRRVVLGRTHAPELSLQRAVMASCAIPGVYPPVPYRRRQLIDGGAHSTTNLDLVAGYETVVCLAPMGFDRQRPPGAFGQATRSFANRSLATEISRARRRGSRVLLFVPSAGEVRRQGLNMMRSRGLLAVAEAAYESTLARLGQPGYRSALEDLRRREGLRSPRDNSARREAGSA
jgi:NTE family protein